MHRCLPMQSCRVCIKFVYMVNVYTYVLFGNYLTLLFYWLFHLLCDYVTTNDHFSQNLISLWRAFYYTVFSGNITHVEVSEIQKPSAREGFKFMTVCGKGYWSLIMCNVPLHINWLSPSQNVWLFTNNQ